VNTHSNIEVGRRELAHRITDGVEVTLYWTPRTNALAVNVYDQTTDDSFELVLGPQDSPLEVFRHPYAYAAWRGIDYQLPQAEAA
jgi:hypothetical protein